MRGIPRLVVMVFCISLILCTVVHAQEERWYAEEFNLTVQAEWWVPRIEGEIQGEEGFISGDKIDVREILDVEVPRGVPYGEISFRLGEYDWLNVNAFRVRMTSDNEMLRRDIRYNAVDFMAGERVNTELDLADFRMAYERVLLARAEGRPVDLNAFGGLSYTWWEQEIYRVPQGEPAAHDDSYSVLPHLGIRAETALWDIVVLGAEYSFGYLDWGDYETRTQRFTMDLGYNITEIVSLRVGFRRYLLDMEADDAGGTDMIDWSLDGFNVSLVCRF